MPMPILMRDKWVHIRLSRGSEYSQLRQLDGQAGLVRLGPGGEDVEDQLGAVEHLDADRLLPDCGSGPATRSLSKMTTSASVGLDRAASARRPCPCRCRSPASGALSLLRQPADDRGAGRFDQAGQFVQGIVVIGVLGKLDAHQDGGFALDALLAVV